MQRLQEVDTRLIQLPEPPPEGFEVHIVECISEVEIHDNNLFLSCQRLTRIPVQRLHLALCGVMPAEPLLQEVHQPVQFQVGMLV